MISLDIPALNALRFTEHNHRFTVNGEWVPSVSKVTRQWGKPFDQDKWSKIIAKREGVTQEEILARWEAKKNESVALGEFVHTAIELFLDPTAPDNALEEHVESMSTEAHERFHVWSSKVVNRFDGPVFINGKPAIEFPVYHKEFRYAGFGDLFAETKAGIWVFDWKTNGEYNQENKYGDKMLAPFEDLPNCEHSEYSIQGCLLRMALESHGITTAGSATAWLGPKGALKIKVGMDLRDRLAEVLRHNELARKGKMHAAAK